MVGRRPSRWTALVGRVARPRSGLARRSRWSVAQRPASPRAARTRRCCGPGPFATTPVREARDRFRTGRGVWLRLGGYLLGFRKGSSRSPAAYPRPSCSSRRTGGCSRSSCCVSPRRVPSRSSSRSRTGSRCRLVSPGRWTTATRSGWSSSIRTPRGYMSVSRWPTICSPPCGAVTNCASASSRRGAAGGAYRRGAPRPVRRRRGRVLRSGTPTSALIRPYPGPCRALPGRAPRKTPPAGHEICTGDRDARRWRCHRRQPTGRLARATIDWQAAFTATETLTFGADLNSLVLLPAGAGDCSPPTRQPKLADNPAATLPEAWAYGYLSNTNRTKGGPEKNYVLLNASKRSSLLPAEP